jgi:hypothetical protein
MNKTRYAYSPSRIKQEYNEQLNLNQVNNIILFLINERKITFIFIF